MNADPAGRAGTVALGFLDEVIQEILASWSDDSFLDRESAEREFAVLATWIREGGNRDLEPGVLSDRLLTRRLAELLTYAVIAHWDREQNPDPEGYMTVLSALRRVPSGVTGPGEHGFAARLSDPDGFELVAQLGHDLRSPLTSITFLAETLRGGFSGPVSDHQRYQLGLIYGAAVGLSSVVTDVVDLARTAADPLDGEAQAFSIHSTLESVRRIVQPLADLKEIEFRTSIQTHDRVRGHSMAVSRALLNLVINGL